MAEKSKQNTLFVGSLDKGLQVLAAFSPEHREMGLTEIAQATGLDKSAVQRLVNTLHQTGWLAKNETTKKLRPSIKYMEMAYAYAWSDEIIKHASPYLIELGRKLNESVNLAEPSGSDIVYVMRIPNHLAQFAATLSGRRLPALNTSSGRAILSAMPEDTIRHCVENWPLHRFTARTSFDRQEILKSVLEAKAKGYCLTRDQAMENAVGIAAPVRGIDGRPVAAVHCSVSALRWNIEDINRQIVPLVADVAEAIVPPVHSLATMV